MIVRRAPVLDLGVAIGADAISVVPLPSRGFGRTRRADSAATATTFPIDGDLQDPVTALSRAFLVICEHFDVERARIYATLLPPVTRIRLIRLPFKDRDDAERALQWEVSRHFTGIHEPHVVAVDLPRALDRMTEPALVAVAPEAMVRAVQTAVAAVGWEVVRVAPGHAAWLHAACHGQAGADPQSAGTRMPKRDQGQRAFSGTLVVDGPVSIRLHVEEGRIREIRRSRTGFEENRPDRAPVDSEVGCIRSSYASADSSRSTTSAPTNLPRPSAAGSLHVSGTDRQFTCDAAVSAARFAAEANAELLLDDIRDHRDRQRRRMFSHRIVAAAMLLVATAGAEWLGATRELAVARERRDAIAGEVAPLIDLRADVAMAGERIAMIRELSRGSHWTPLLLDLALLLPDDAWLLGLRTSGDTVALDAVAANAGRSLEALRRSQAIMDLHIDGNIRRDVEDGQVTIERFRLLGRLPAAQPAIQQ